jgi:hypothetical protein
MLPRQPHLLDRRRSGGPWCAPRQPAHLARQRSCLDPAAGKTPSKEDRHARAVRSCGGYSIVGVNGNDAAVYPLRCKRWRCPGCGPRLVRRARDRIRAGITQGPTRFLTLTSPGTESPEQSFDELTERWKRMSLRIGRRFGAFDYVAVIEIQKRGSPHLHVIVRGPFIPLPWLARAAGEVGFGRVVDIRRPRSDLAGYLAKSLGPGTSGDLLPSHFHRVRWSRGWSTAVAKRLRRACQAWYVAFASPARTAASAAARGLRVVAFVHGPLDRLPSRFPVHWQPLALFARR